MLEGMAGGYGNYNHRKNKGMTINTDELVSRIAGEFKVPGVDLPQVLSDLFDDRLHDNTKDVNGAILEALKYLYEAPEEYVHFPFWSDDLMDIWKENQCDIDDFYSNEPWINETATTITGIVGNSTLYWVQYRFIIAVDSMISNLEATTLIRFYDRNNRLYMIAPLPDDVEATTADVKAMMEEWEDLDGEPCASKSETGKVIVFADLTDGGYVAVTLPNAETWESIA